MKYKQVYFGSQFWRLKSKIGQPHWFRSLTRGQSEGSHLKPGHVQKQRSGSIVPSEDTSPVTKGTPIRLYFIKIHRTCQYCYPRNQVFTYRPWEIMIQTLTGVSLLYQGSLHSFGISRGYTDGKRIHQQLWLPEL
jgi:hypothetical protein